MTEKMTRQDEILIVLVEDDPHHRKKMKEILNETFPDCQVKTIGNGVEALNYLLTPINNYHLVILDGRLDTYAITHFTKINGPDVAEALKEKNINVPVVLWTNDPTMLQRFDKVYGKRLPEIEKPCRQANVAVVLTPIISEIRHLKLEKGMEENEGAENYSSTAP